MFFTSILILLFYFEKHNVENFTSLLKEKLAYESVLTLSKIFSTKDLTISFVKEKKTFFVSAEFDFEGRKVYVIKDLTFEVIVLSVLSLIFFLFLMGIITFKRKEIIKKVKIISEDLAKIEGNLKYFQNYLEYNPIVKKMKVEELESLKESVNYLQEIIVRNERELLDSIDEVVKTKKDLEDINTFLTSAYEILANVNPKDRIEDVAQYILEELIDIFKDVNAGSIILKQNNKFKYFAQVGYTDKLKEIEFCCENDVIAIQFEGYVSGDVIKNKNNEVFDEVFKEVGSEKIKSTYVIPIYVEQEKVGSICLDSFVNDKLKIPEYVNIFGKIFGNFLILKVYENSYKKMFFEILKMFVESVDKRVGKIHSRNVANLSKKLAKVFGVDEMKTWEAAMLHDIGKVFLSDRILKKPGRLTNAEKVQIQNHVKIGYEILNRFEFLKDISKIVLYHHERCDGKGIFGLKCEEIPLESRIILVVDAYFTMKNKGFDDFTIFDELYKDVENGKLDRKVVEELEKIVRRKKDE
ncbi:metal dependent phosphohydrolase [Thermosipho melanesiensis BI429]|uniref:Metal dependent phosphohydrolase n=2 Tax=Thermosipho melanesiensis TaxID=46541 RepID=A6LJN5_THEM4|nr:metal dependent phosphohydrolase [Thermosipho melanesiensis BI429]